MRFDAIGPFTAALAAVASGALAQDTAESHLAAAKAAAGTEHVAIVQAVVNIARALGMTTTAEGVETVAQHEFLVALGTLSAARPDLDILTTDARHLDPRRSTS